MKLFVTVLFVVLLFSCSENQQHSNVQNQLPQFKIKANDIQLKVNVPDIVKNVDYIPLESGKNCLIGSVDLIRYKDKKFYILDKSITMSLFVFKDNGDFLFKINKIGGGPGEYKMLNGFDLDSNENIYLGDIISKKIVVYDPKGNFIKEYKTHFFFEDFCISSTEDILVQNVFENEKVETLLGKLNLVSGNLTSIINGRNYLDDFDIPKFSTINLFKTDSSVFIHPRFGCNVYKITGSIISNFIEVDSTLIPSKPFIEKFKKDMLALQDSRYIMDIGNIYETSGFICLRLQEKFPMNYIISKKTSNSICVATFDKIIYLGNNRFYGVMEDKFISLIEPTVIDNNWLGKIELSKLDQCYKDLLLQYNYTMNPIICLVEFEKF